MANQVVKKDGRKEPFDVEKIKKGISLAGQEAGFDEAKLKEITEQIAQEVVEAFQNKEEVKAIEIRDKILAELDIYAPTIAASWRDYEMREKKR